MTPANRSSDKTRAQDAAGLVKPQRWRAQLAHQDRTIFAAVLTHRRPSVIAAARIMSGLGEPGIVYPVLAAAGLVAGRRAGWQRAGLPCLAVATGALARRQLSRIIARPRPPATAWLTEPEGFSLPSRHTTLAALAGWLFAEAWLYLADGVTACQAPPTTVTTNSGLQQCRRRLFS